VLFNKVVGISCRRTLCCLASSHGSTSKDSGNPSGSQNTAGCRECQRYGITDVAVSSISPRSAFAAFLLCLATGQARGLLSLHFLDSRTTCSIRHPAGRLHGICRVHGDGISIMRSVGSELGDGRAPNILAGDIFDRRPRYEFSKSALRGSEGPCNCRHRIPSLRLEFTF
jgi:hypothetical protein